MSPSDVGHALQGIAATAFLIWFFYGPWQRLLVDMFRQSVFEVRDRLFLMAADGRIAFEDPVYGALRGRLNALIRQAERYTWTTVVAADVASKNDTKQARDLLSVIRSHDDRAVVLELEALYMRAVLLMVFLIVARSALLMVVTFLSLPFALSGALSRFDRFKGRVTRPVSDAIEHDLPVNATA